MTLLKWSEIRKLSARQDLLWSSFLTMSFFPREGKDLLKFLSREKESLSLPDHARGSFLRMREILTMSFFPREGKDLLKYKEPSSRQCLSQEREKTCYLRWLSESYLRSVGIETI